MLRATRAAGVLAPRSHPPGGPSLPLTQRTMFPIDLFSVPIICFVGHVAYRVPPPQESVVGGFVALRGGAQREDGGVKDLERHRRKRQKREFHFIDCYRNASF